jgi:hypothetical protein
MRVMAGTMRMAAPAIIPAASTTSAIADIEIVPPGARPPTHTLTRH